MSIQQPTKFSVIKSSGETVEFKESKLLKSLQRSGVSKAQINRILPIIKKNLYNGISTEQIYRLALKLLKKESGSHAARYNLKRAIYDLGPTGFPFEKFIEAILSFEGFDTNVDVIVEGACVQHEIDVIAEKENRHLMVECKFHNERGINCNVKVPLYIHSRFRDVQAKLLPGNEVEQKNYESWIFTNTRFTEDAIKYGKCAGLELIGWNYPEHKSLNRKIDESGLHPVTCLTTLTMREKRHILQKNIVLCKDLFNEPDLLKNIGISDLRQTNILNEAYALCNT